MNSIKNLRAAAELDAHDLAEMASATLPEGPLATIDALLEGLALRHAGDSATLAALIAIQDLHLLNLLDDRNAESRDALLRP